MQEALGGEFTGESITLGQYTFPHYLQKDYPGSYGTSTIPAAGCGPTSLAMILSGIKNDSSITPQTVVANIKDNWPGGDYYVPGVGSSHCIFWSSFLEKYYGVTSQMTTSQDTALDALEKGYPVIGGETGHILALLPVSEEQKAQGYKFAILDTFKEMSKELDEVMTLSIGIGKDSRVLRELDEMASAALNLTYSRGGDQVAVKSGEDKKVRFFGGNSDTFEKSSKVRARVIAQSLAGLIKNASQVIVMGHKNSDLDSFGASLGVAKIAMAYGKKTTVIVDFESIEKKTKEVAVLVKADPRYKGMIQSANEAIERVDKNTLLIVVDNHKSSLALSKALLERVKNKVIIDHHRRGEEFIEAPVLTYLEPASSSTVELVIELCDYQNVDLKINELDATIMYAGMLVDTNNFKQRVGVRTFQSAAHLKELQANVPMAYEFIKDSYEETLQRLSIAQTAYQYRPDILIACGQESEEYNSSLLAKSSNALLEISGIKASFSIGRISKTKVAISARSTKDMNVQVIMEALDGGGHFSMAAAQFENKTIEEVRLLLEEKIQEYLDDRGEV